MRIKRRKTYIKPLQINQRPKYSNSVSNFVNKQHFKRMFRRAGVTVTKKRLPVACSLIDGTIVKLRQDITTLLKQRMFHIIWDWRVSR